MQRLKSLGGNTIRFHLGLPPDRILDLCDRYGLMVQAEWGFFHGIKASRESLLEQWPAWFEASLKHPSVVLMHGWNETENADELIMANGAINQVAAAYAPVVIGHRDVIHLHKYWWSLFENLGLYYDSYRQFPLPVMADEFGGNYLDENGEIGKYPTNPASFQRFLGRNSTKQERLYHQAIANGRVAEYWRRIGVAGFSPFCTLSSPEDGNTWFLGPLAEGNPKPVWQAMAAAYAPVSASLDMWDRHFEPGQQVKIPITFFNDEANTQHARYVLSIQDLATGKINQVRSIQKELPRFSRQSQSVLVTMPAAIGRFKISIELKNPPFRPAYPVVSEWEVQVIKPILSKRIQQIVVGVDPREKELVALFRHYHIKTTQLFGPRANLSVVSKASWPALARDTARLDRQGKKILLLEAGPGNLSFKPDLKNLDKQGQSDTGEPGSVAVVLPFHIQTVFEKSIEPESHFQYAERDSSLWNHLDKDAGWLWNGYRGGLVLPATSMHFEGLSPAAFLKSWQSKGADTSKVKSGAYFAYELSGSYAFSNGASDENVKAALRRKVRFLLDDAPALKGKIDPEGPIAIRDLGKDYLQTQHSKGLSFQPLATAGKGLENVPVALLKLKSYRSSLLVCQLLTTHRLVKQYSLPGFYGPRYDPAAVQFVFNMMDKLLQEP